MSSTSSIGESPAVVLSSGEPAGIGPDICALLALEELPARLAVLGDPVVLGARVEQLALPLRLAVRERASDVQPHRAGTMQVLAIPTRTKVVPGQLDPDNADYVLSMLRLGVELCTSRGFAALVTAPVHKSVISEAGVPFSGHTEFLAQLMQVELPVMMLTAKALRVALATTHLPLRDVADSLDSERLEAMLAVIDHDLRSRFAIDNPRLLVLGLNPHAGESGTLGTEEQTIIRPAVENSAASGLRVWGPVSADTAFTEESLSRCDLVLAMYHDQGLPVVKAMSFGRVVNVTLGLPIIRTSVDHGTVLNLAGTGRARQDSLRAALEMACQLAQRAKS